MLYLICFFIFIGHICFAQNPERTWNFSETETNTFFYNEAITDEVQQQFAPFNYAPELIPYFAYLKNQFQIQVAIETGTWKAETTQCLAFLFDQVHTIEIQTNFFEQACQTLSGDLNAHVHFGNSSQVLKDLLPELSSFRSLFYLDAHWFSYWPLLDELKAIATTHKDNCIIVIDDVKVPERLDIPYDVYNETEECGYEYVKASLAEIYSSYKYFYVIPKSIYSRAKLVIIPSSWIDSNGI
jgi:hypothetical protein